ncbi:MAG: hypothetical protein KDD62_16095, partial [Bdellovibrionales bacterium]|nr:hypothetical protein [Bdellovibrionales bacterium]
MIDRINSFFLVSVLTLEIVVIWNLELWGLQLHDRFSFWAASRSFLDHQNPYLLDQVMEHVKLCCQALPPENTPIERIWGIPIIFALISWFGLF